MDKKDGQELGEGRGINHKKCKRRKNTPFSFPNLCVFCAIYDYFSYFLIGANGASLCALGDFARVYSKSRCPLRSLWFIPSLSISYPFSRRSIQMKTGAMADPLS